MSGFLNRLRLLPWSMIGILCLIGLIGILMLYSAGNGSFYPWANKQGLRFVFAFILMLLVAQSDIRRWLHYSYAIYCVAFLLLLVVEGVGLIGMGAQRWIDLYFFHLQPSEVMKIALVLALARFFHQTQKEDLSRFRTLLIPLMLIIAPVALVMKQPDLGTAIILFGLGVALFFIAGVSIYYFMGGGILLVALIPIMWHFLHQYQRNRVLNFLNPEHDPLNTGYQILQSKIALGSGGLFGKGYLKGSQSHLNFLPAKQTDFIFTMLCEEWGLFGGFFLIMCYDFLMIYGLRVASSNRNRFGRLVATGMIMTLFLYVFINMAMVMGLVPVVGVPLPFITYGGTSLLTLMIGFGLIFAVDQNRDRSGPRFLT